MKFILFSLAIIILAASFSTTISNVMVVSVDGYQVGVNYSNGGVDTLYSLALVMPYTEYRILQLGRVLLVARPNAPSFPEP